MIDESTISIVLQALSFAARKHSNQRRKGSDHAPYINHPISVLDLLWRVGGVRQADVLAAGVLHDTLEDTNTSPQELEAAFGLAVLELVKEVSDDKTLLSTDRKRLQIEHASQLSNGAKLIKLADKISNVRDLHSNPPLFWSRQRRLEYLDWAARVVERLRGINPALEAEFDRVSKEK
jgi:guanosine-3',5'-bis(diphosphate) 3'-pyrophosphohydrolase